MAYPYNPNIYYQPQQFQPQQGYQQTPQIQNGGFISVRSEEEARNYPVAPGNSVTFKNETAPYIYTKTMGFSQLDRPIFDKFKLVKEEPVQSVQTEDGAKSNLDIDEIKSEIESLWSEVNAIKNTAKKDGGDRHGEQSE